MTYLLWFIIGAFTVDVLLPIVEKIGEWIINMVQFKISCIQVDMAKLQKIVDKMQVDGEGSTHAIGFSIPDDEYEDDEYE